MIHLRPIESEDLPFLRQVYASSREQELACVDWQPGQQEAFLRMQFDAQHRYYTEHYRDADFLLILKDDRPIGRLYVHRGSDEIRVVDIALLPEFQREGTGSRLLGSLLDEARETARPVRIHVERYNPALRWYERLGFTPIEEGEVYLFLEWNPPPT